MGTTRGPQPEAQTPGEGAARARAVVLLAVRRRKCGGQAVLRAELGGVQPGRGRSTGLRRPCAHCVRTPYAKCALHGRRCSRYAWAWMLSSVLVISIRCSAGTAAPDTSSPNRAPSSPRPTPATGRPWSRPGAPAQPPWVVVVPGLPADTATKTDDTAQPRDERPAVPCRDLRTLREPTDAGRRCLCRAGDLSPRLIRAPLAPPRNERVEDWDAGRDDDHEESDRRK